ncbi:MAG TPA: EAL domain-containing protein [Burkholderiales bacterium]|nr:EAL domain-containing protein [Burkholderiales bacterium]
MDATLRGYTLDFIQSMLTEESGGISGWFEDLELKSAFQPAFSLPQKHIVGFEASLRAVDANGKPVSPETLFGPVQNYAEAAMLDMLSTTLHVHNFFSRRPSHGILFVNLHPEVLLDSDNSARFLDALFSHYEVTPRKVMIDIPGAVLKDARLGAAIARYRELGCLISVDDFGVENSDLDSIWHAAPSVVKMGRSVITTAMHDPRARQMLPRAVSLLHEMGSLVLMEGLESEGQTMLAIDADADFASGFFFGPHIESTSQFSSPNELLNGLWNTYKSQPSFSKAIEQGTRASLENEMLHSSLERNRQKATPADIARYRDQRRPYIAAIQEIAEKIVNGAVIETSGGSFLDLHGAIRCFVLDAGGKLVSTDVYSKSLPPRQSADFYSLSAHHEGEWSRRDFFRRAIKEPEVVQVTRQQSSLTGYRNCVTFSLATRTSLGKPVVVCGDVDWSMHAALS